MMLLHLLLCDVAAQQRSTAKREFRLTFSPHTMQRRPRNPDEPIVDRWLLMRYIVIGTYVGLAKSFFFRLSPLIFAQAQHICEHSLILSFSCHIFLDLDPLPGHGHR